MLAMPLESEIHEPFDLRWLHFGVEPGDVHRVAENAVRDRPFP